MWLQDTQRNASAPARGGDAPKAMPPRASQLLTCLRQYGNATKDTASTVPYAEAQRSGVIAVGHRQVHVQRERVHARELQGRVCGRLWRSAMRSCEHKIRCTASQRQHCLCIPSSLRPPAKASLQVRRAHVPRSYWSTRVRSHCTLCPLLACSVEGVDMHCAPVRQSLAAGS